MTNNLPAVAIRLLLFILLAAWPFAGWALGLGQLSMKSALDEPLVAEIELLAVEAAERGTIEASLAPVEEFAKAGVGRPQHLGAITFAVASRPDGRTFIKLTTEESLREPFLHFLVQVEWSGGRLLREYTALLDPPLYAKGPAPAVTAPTVSAPVVTPAPEPAAPVAEPAAPSAVAVSPVSELLGPPIVEQGVPLDLRADVAAPTAPMAVAQQIGPTQRGDSLWVLASRLKQQMDLSEYQIMLALLRENPEAFIENNMNRLKRGRVLKVPPRETVSAIPLAEATRDYAVQLEQWQEYKSAVAQVAPSVKAKAEPTAEPVAETKPMAEVAAAEAGEAAAEAGEAAAEVPAPDTKAAAAVDAAEAEAPAAKAEMAVAGKAEAAAAAGDRLRIVQATLDKDQAAEAAQQAGAGSAETASGEAVKLRDEIATLEEALAAREMENTELRERVKLLEEQVSNATRLIELQDQDLALAQQQADSAQREAAVAKTEAEVAQAEAARRVPGATEEVVTPPAQPAPAVTTPQPRVAPGRVTRAPSKSLLEKAKDFLASPFGIGLGGVAALVLGVLGLWFFRMRRARAEFEESILDGTAMDSVTETSAQTAAGTGPTSDTSFLSDFGVPGMGSMQADEVDPLAEAEVYLAYGRSEQAEEVLKEAIGKNAERDELKLKLLEIYEQRSDVKAFETLAEEMYPAAGQDEGGLWTKVSEMGSRLNPDNPLFKAAAVVTAGAAAAGLAGAVESTETPGTEDFEPFPEPDEAGDLALDLADVVGEAEEDTGFEGPAEISGASLEMPDELGLPADLDLESALEDQGTQEMETLDVGTTEEMEAASIPGLEDVDLDLGGESVTDETPATQIMDAAEMAAASGAATDTLKMSSDELLDTAELSLDTEEDLLKTDELELPPGATPTEEFTLDSLELPDDATETLDLADAAEAAAGEDTQEITLADDTLAMANELVDDTRELRLDDASAAGLGAATASTDEPVDDAVTPSQQMRWDETATKLDLAKAYIDMGDEPGARSILDEVLAEGSDTQKRQAQDLASELGA